METNDYTMSYSPSELVDTKYSPEIGTDITFGYTQGYNNSAFYTHQPQMAYSSTEEDIMMFRWDMNGQLTHIGRPYKGSQLIAQAESLWDSVTNTEDLGEQNILSADVYIGGSGSTLPACQYSPQIAQLSGYHGNDILSRVFSGRASERTLTDTIGIYFYHADHLGSASWITNSQGQAMQYIHYMPYGELWVNQQANSYDERFKFTGKERDVETGYDYFGARYYSPMIGHWLSVDPLSDEQPRITPYAYCKWSPINRLDPDGMIDYDMVKMGLSTMAIGGGTAVGGAAISATGVGSPIGALLIVDGIAGVGIGASLSITGLLTEPSEQNTYIMNNIPTNATSAITKSADQIAGNEHHEIEYVVGGIMLMAGLSQPASYSNKAEEIYSLLSTGAEGGQLLFNVGREIISAKSFIEERVTIDTTTLPNDNTRVYTIDIYKPHAIEYE